MYKVTHLIPKNGIGGVEVAAKSCDKFLDQTLDFSVIFIINNKLKGNFINSFFSYIKTIFLLRKSDSNLYILSLWKTVIVALILKALGSQARFITFLHSPVRAHILDSFFTWISIKLSDEIWGDSYSSINSVNSHSEYATKVISFMTNIVEPLSYDGIKPKFIFWGRLSKEKNLGLSLKIFKGIKKYYSDASFYIIGPEDGAADEIYRLTYNYDLVNSVIFLGPLSAEEIRVAATSCCFYLQSSYIEGRSMSVMEAMQMGLVPIITPVGGISEYCIHGSNSIFIKDEISTVELISDLIKNEAKYLSLRESSINTFRDVKTYKESIITACKIFSEKNAKYL